MLAGNVGGARGEDGGLDGELGEGNGAGCEDGVGEEAEGG